MKVWWRKKWSLEVWALLELTHKNRHYMFGKVSIISPWYPYWCITGIMIYYYLALTSVILGSNPPQSNTSNVLTVWPERTSAIARDLKTKLCLLRNNLLKRVFVLPTKCMENVILYLILPQSFSLLYVIYICGDILLILCYRARAFHSYWKQWWVPLISGSASWFRPWFIHRHQ